MTSETRCATAVEALMTASTGTYSRQGVERNIGQMPKQNLRKANVSRYVEREYLEQGGWTNCGCTWNGKGRSLQMQCDVEMESTSG
jgi:hypothetical protein